MSWRWTKIGDCAELISGAAFKSNQFTVNSDDVPLVKGENVQQGFIDWDIAKRWPKPDMPSYERFLLAPNDIVVAMDRPWVPAGLKWAFIADSDPQALLVQRVARLRVASSTSAKFLKYVIASKAFSDYVKNIMGGTNVPHISGDQIRAFAFRRPSLPLQEKIGDWLSVYDDLIENNRRRIALLEQSARLLYREWFVHLRFPGHEHVKVVDGVPEGWERLPFSALADYLNGYPFKPAELFSEGLPIIKIPELRDGATDKTPRNPGEDIPEKYFVKDKDLLFSWSGTLLVNFWHQGSALLNQHLFRVDPLRGCGKEFLFFAIDCAMPAFTNQTTGATMKHIRKSALDSVTTLCPNGVLMREFQDCVEPTFDLIHKLNQTNDRLRAARDLLLPRLMSGDLVV